MAIKCLRMLSTLLVFQLCKMQMSKIKCIHSTAKYVGKDLGELARILNMEVNRTVEGGLFLSQ